MFGLFAEITSQNFQICGRSFVQHEITHDRIHHTGSNYFKQHSKWDA